MAAMSSSKKLPLKYHRHLARERIVSGKFAAAMMAWGILTSCTVMATNYTSLMILRTFIGAVEAFIQGSILYLSFRYPYNELATRGAVLYSAIALSDSFNGLLAFGIQSSLDGVNGWSAWQWFFFIGGIIPIVWSFVILIFLPSTPETARWYFKPEEKEVVIRRSRASHNTGDSKIRPMLILKLLSQPQFYMVVLIDAGPWLRNIQAQLMTVVVYVFAFIGIIGSAVISDKIHKRGLIICVCTSYAALGYVLILALTNNAGRLVATCVVAAGVYPIVMLSLVWTASNNVGYTFRVSAPALINVLAQTFSIGGNFAYSDPLYYRQGLSASLGMISMSGVVAGLLWLYYKSLNVKKAQMQSSEEAAGLRDLTVDEIGIGHPGFVFSY
ncbi:major facilitator superfamily domain-containing protein [Xylariales sp. AK1849]|nr:major facilitator superfamily domain-containing protein [Xylariales sp. AK1849]